MSLDPHGFCPPPVHSSHNPYGDQPRAVVKGELSVGAIIGISIGGAAIIGLIVFMIWRRVKGKGRDELSENQNMKPEMTVMSHENTRRENEFFMSKLNKDAATSTKAKHSEDSNVTLNKISNF